MCRLVYKKLWAVITTASLKVYYLQPSQLQYTHGSFSNKSGTAECIRSSAETMCSPASKPRDRKTSQLHRENRAAISIYCKSAQVADPRTVSYDISINQCWSLQHVMPDFHRFRIVPGWSTTLLSRTRKNQNESREAVPWSLSWILQHRHHSSFAILENASRTCLSPLVQFSQHLLRVYFRFFRWNQEEYCQSTCQ